jgi:hypothetical protein
MGPAERVAQFKAIETDPTAPQPFAPAGYFGLPQIRWLPTNIAGFLDSNALGSDYRRDLFMGGARDFLEGGHLSASS